MSNNKRSQTLDRLYDYFADEEDARVCTDITDKACKEVPGNFFSLLLSQCLTMLGDTLASTKIVLPWVMSQSGVPAFFTGLLVPIRESGSLLPQLLLGSVIRRHAIRKWFFVLGCILQGLCVLGMAAIAYAFQGIEAGIYIIAVLVIFSLARGLCSVSSKDVLGKTVPKTRRGRLSGLAASISGLVTLGVALLLWFDVSGGENQLYLLLVVAALLWFLAALVFARIVEYPGATEGGSNAISEAFQRLSLLKDDKPFRHFVIVRALMMSSGLSAPFLIIMAQSQNGSQAIINLSLFIGVSGLAGLLSGNIWGKLADHSSRQVMLAASLATASICAMAAILLILWQSVPTWLVVILYFFITVAHQGTRLGRKTYIVDLADGNKRTDYVAVSNTMIGVLLLMAGVLSAIIAQWSLLWVFIFFSGVSGIAWLFGHKLPEA